MEHVGTIVFAAVCCLVALVLLFGLVCMAVAVLPLVRRWAEDDSGPWCVEAPDEPRWRNPTHYMTFDYPAEYTFTSVPSLAERFPRKHDAEEWARVVGGRAVAEREVGHD